jgi:hypothetical protein
MSTSIGNVSGATRAQYLQPQRGISSAAVKDSDGDYDGTRASAPSSSSGKGGLLASAIKQALSQIGATGSSTSAAAGTTDPQQALGLFIQNLFAALGAQAGQAAAAQGGKDSDGDNDGSSASSVSAPSGSGHHHHGGGKGGLEAKLQSLVQQLSTSSTSPARDGSTVSPLSALQQSFQSLLGSLGASGDPATLRGFLQTLSQDLQGVSPTGNMIDQQT